MQLVICLLWIIRVIMMHLYFDIHLLYCVCQRVRSRDWHLSTETPILCELGCYRFLSTLVVKPTLVDQIKAAQKCARGIRYIKGNIASGKAKCFTLDNEGTIYFENRIVVPKNKNVRQLILKEAHESPLSIHPGSTKMYQDLRQRFWWTRMKREIARVIAECDVCCR